MTFSKKFFARNWEAEKLEHNHSVVSEKYQTSRSLLAEIRRLLAVSNPTDEELKRLVLMRVYLREISPRNRYVWIDGRPAFDLWEELTKIELEAENGKI
jgi:hypothetical protein